MKGTKNLGLMTVKKTVEGEIEEIKIESEVTYRVLFAFTIRYKMYEKFRGNNLDWGKALSTLNGRTQKESKIVSSTKGHTLTLDGVSVEVEDQIDYSISQIYFEEPKDGQVVFSQQFAQFLTFKKVDEHRYLLASPDGDNFYTYVNGICADVRVQRDFANFNFVIQPKTMKAIQSKADSLFLDAN